MMPDPTENVRRELVQIINEDVESQDKEKERERLEGVYGPVWDTQQLSAKFEVIGFMAPFVHAREKATGKHGTLAFTHSPRFYFMWEEDGDA